MNKIQIINRDENYFYYSNNKKLPVELVYDVIDKSLPYKFNAWPSLYLLDHCDSETMYIGMIRSMLHYFDSGGDAAYREWIKNKKSDDLRTYTEYMRDQQKIENAKKILTEAGYKLHETT